MTDKRAQTNISYLALYPSAGPEELVQAEVELRAAGIEVLPGELRDALILTNASRNPWTGEWAIPSYHQPTFGFDELQDDLKRETGLTGPALYAAWAKVKGHLRARWAAGNFKKPAAQTLAKWASR